MAALLKSPRRLHVAARFALAFSVAFAAAMGIIRLDSLTAAPPDFEQACLDGDPFYVASALRGRRALVTTRHASAASTAAPRPASTAGGRPAPLVEVIWSDHS